MLTGADAVMPAPQVATCGLKNGATRLTRSQPALSSAGRGGQMMPRGDVSTSLAGPVMVVAKAASTSVVHHAFPHCTVACELDRLDVCLVKPPNAMIASEFLVQGR
jgi:hypothetical protein